MTVHESIEAQQKAKQLDTAYENKWEKYEENPDLARQEREKANQTFTSTKPAEEIDKYKIILEEVEKLKLLPENEDKHSDELFEIAEKIVEERELKENKQNPEEKIRENYENLTSEININNPENSVLNRLVESWKLTGETNEIIEINIETNWTLDKDLKESITNKDDLSIIENTLKQIPENRDSIPVDNLYNFKKDFPELSDIAINWVEAKWIKKWEEPESKEILAYRYIWENYIKIWDNPEDKDKNYSTAIKTASANILKNNTIKDKDSIAFQQAILNIHWENKEKQFEWLTSLIWIAEKEKNENWAIANKLKLKTKPKLKEQLENLKAEYKVLEKNKNNDIEYYNIRKKEIIKEWNKIQELLKEKPKSWEVMWWTKLDKIPGVENKNPGV